MLGWVSDEQAREAGFTMKIKMHRLLPGYAYWDMGCLEDGPIIHLSHWTLDIVDSLLCRPVWWLAELAKGVRPEDRGWYKMEIVEEF